MTEVRIQGFADYLVGLALVLDFHHEIAALAPHSDGAITATGLSLGLPLALRDIPPDSPACGWPPIVLLGELADFTTRDDQLSARYGAGLPFVLPRLAHEHAWWQQRVGLFVGPYHHTAHPP